ncbi:MAG: hypothetical protein QM627_08935 [Luteolibacter sp.]
MKYACGNLAVTSMPTWKSRKNLSRFDGTFVGWRLAVSRNGNTLVRYFPDNTFGGARKSLQAAEIARIGLLEILDNSRKVGGVITRSTVRKAEQFLEEAVPDR